MKTTTDSKATFTITTMARGNGECTAMLRRDGQTALVASVTRGGPDAKALAVEALRGTPEGENARLI